MANLKLLRRESNAVVFADPANPEYTVRFKSTNARKSIDGVGMTNYVTEIIVNDSHVVTIGTKTVKDPIAIRVRTSGAADSMSRLSAVLASVAGQLAAWSSENVLVGFEPDTAPLVVE